MPRSTTNQPDETPRGQAQEVAVMFIDLAGFTGLSERLGPEATAAVLEAYYDWLEAAVEAHGGLVTSYQGDGAMALFGLPAARPDDAARALACAHALLAVPGQVIDDLGAWLRPQIGLRPRIGLHAGPAVVARLGGRRLRQLTAVGDTVNVAHRLERLTREVGASLAVSGAVMAAAQAHGGASVATGLVPLPAQGLRGRRSPVDVWIQRPCELVAAA